MHNALVNNLKKNCFSSKCFVWPYSTKWTVNKSLTLFDLCQTRFGNWFSLPDWFAGAETTSHCESDSLSRGNIPATQKQPLWKGLYTRRAYTWSTVRTIAAKRCWTRRARGRQNCASTELWSHDLPPRWKYYHCGGNIITAVEIFFSWFIILHLIHCNVGPNLDFIVFQLIHVSSSSWFHIIQNQACAQGEIAIMTSDFTWNS